MHLEELQQILHKSKEKMHDDLQHKQNTKAKLLEHTNNWQSVIIKFGIF